MKRMKKMKCDRCGRAIRYAHIIRKTSTVGFINSIFNVQLEQYHLCPRCAESFRKWLYMKRID